MENDLLPKLALQLKRKNYKEVLSLGESVSSEDPLFYPAGIFIYRAYAEQGKTDQAGLELKKLLDEISVTGVDYVPAKLWLTFHHLFTSESIAFDSILKDIEHLVPETSGTPGLLALKYALQSKVISFGVTVGSYSPMKLAEAKKLMESAAENYLQADNIIEYAASIKSISDILQNSSFLNNYSEARKNLELLYHLENYPDQPFFRAVINIELANLMFKEMHTPGNIPNLEKTDQVYNAALSELKEANYPKANGDMHFEYGRFLLEYGYPIGIDILHKAIVFYAETSEVINSQSAWKKIADWHHRHGNDNEAKIAERESKLLDKHIEFKMGKAVQAVIEIHTAFVQHREGFGIELGEKYLEEFKDSRMVPQIRALLANAISQGKRKNVAYDHLLSIIEYYKPSSPSSFLSEAYFNYANAIFLTDESKGIDAMETAIAMAEALKDDLNVAKYTREFATSLGNSNALKRLPPNVKRIEELFKKAFSALEKSNTFLFKIELANTLEKCGLFYSQLKDNNTALNYLQEAAKICQQFGLKLNQAFLSSYEGLVFLQMARDEDSNTFYNDAALRLSYSSLLFSSINYMRFSWRSKHLQGQAFKELALKTDGVNDREQYFQDADLAFSEAANMIDYLKGLASVDEKQILKDKYASNRDFPSSFKDVFTTAFLMHFRLRKNNSLAFSWAGKNKSRQLLAGLSKNSPETQNFLLNKFPHYQEIRTLLYEQEIKYPHLSKILVCEYFIIENEVILFLLRAEWLEPKAYTLPISSGELFTTVNYLFFQGTESLLDKLNDGLENEWSGLFYLIKDILAASAPGETLYIVPHDYLHQLPFHALLYDNGSYLIERNPVVYVPSSAVLYQIMTNNRSQSQSAFWYKNAAIFGDPRSNLKHAELEAVCVGTLLETHPYIGKTAAKAVFADCLTTSGLLHFAGHALSNQKDGLNQSILLATDETFTAFELINSPNNLELLVLSGCETGTSEVQGYIDELVGLTTAALLSGTRSILSTLWKVNDQSTKQFFEYFYDGLINQGLTKAVSLQWAMKKMISNGHSFFNWAPFTLIGKYI